MGRPVRELLYTIGSDELTDWMAYDRIQPFGDDRADLRVAILSALIANIHRPTKGAGSNRTFKPRDFMPFLSRALKGKLLGEDLRAALGHKVKRSDDG